MTRPRNELFGNGYNARNGGPLKFKLLSNLRNIERSMENQFNVGDLVWAKVHGYPWWPSIIYNEALTSAHVQQAKKEGFMLVSFFGDNSYKWLDPKKLLQFESNFTLYSNRSSLRLFLKAVNEAVYEVNHRAALGLTCPCLFFSSYQSAHVEGYLEVGMDGYQSGGVYTVEQLNGFRQEFQPVKTLSFVQSLALDSINVHQGLNFSKDIAKVLAFRKAKYAEVDEPYFFAFGVDPSGAPADHSSEAESKDQTIKYQNKNKRCLATPKHKPDATKTNCQGKRNPHHDSNSKTSQDHVPQKKRHVSSQKKREKEEKSGIVEGPKMVISMKFPSGAILPSASELKAKFAVFGPLDLSHIHVSYFKSRCQVAFMNKPDAQKAYEHAVNFKNMFGQTNVSYRMHPKASKSDHLESGINETDAPFCQETYAEHEQADQTQMQVNQGSVDISEKMLYLLHECSRIVFELNQF